MAVAEMLIHKLSPTEAALFFADRALKHQEDLPLIAGFYGDQSHEKSKFIALAEGVLAVRRRSPRMHIVGMSPKPPAEFWYDYHRMWEGVNHTFPLVLIHVVDPSLSYIDFFTIEMMQKFPEFTVVVGPEKADYSDVMHRALGYRERCAVEFKIPFTLPEFIHIAIPT